MSSLLNLGQIQTEIEANLGKRSDFTASATRMNILIDLAQMRIARLKDFDELRDRKTFTVTSSGVPATDKVLSISTILGSGITIRKIYSIRIVTGAGDSNRLRWVPTQHWDTEIPEPEYYDTGQPSHYTKWGTDRLEIWRSPDQNYSAEIRYSKWPKKASALQTSSNLDLENLDDAIIALATSYGFMSFGRRDKASEWFSIYGSMIREAQLEDDESFDNLVAGFRAGGDPLIPDPIADPFVKSTIG